MIAETTKIELTPEEQATRVFLHAAESLGLKGGGLARATGLSEATISRMRTGPALLTLGTKTHELSLIIVRIHAALMKIFEGDAVRIKDWMQSHQAELKGKPADRVEDIRGIVSLLIYTEIRASSL